MIWCYVTSFVVWQSVWLFLRIFKINTFHIKMILYHRHLILEKRRRRSVIEESKKSKMSRVYLSLMEEPKDILAKGEGVNLGET